MPEHQRLSADKHRPGTLPKSSQGFACSAHTGVARVMVPTVNWLYGSPDLTLAPVKAMTPLEKMQGPQGLHLLATYTALPYPLLPVLLEGHSMRAESREQGRQTQTGAAPGPSKLPSTAPAAEPAAAASSQTL